MVPVARLATTSDVFNAVAEPRRRQILNLLVRGERPVGEIARALRVRHPQASKHLSVLKQVGLVQMRGVGQQRLYRLNARALKPVHDWVSTFEQYWHERLDRLDAYLKSNPE